MLIRNLMSRKRWHLEGDTGLYGVDTAEENGLKTIMKN